MAGAGYKLFSTGDVLSASDVNTYLMQQTVMSFASAAARTTALSGILAEGLVSYLQDTNVVEIYTGAAWVSLDDPNAIQNSIVDAKGDLLTATADNTPARLAVGTNAQVLTADSTAATGLKWATPSVGALTLVTSGTFSSVTSFSVNSCFSATYKNYLIFINPTSTSATNTFVLRASATDAITAYYYGNLAQPMSATGPTSSGAANTTSWALGTFQSGYGQKINVQNPAVASPTSFDRSVVDTNGATGNFNNGGGWHNTATAYDGFTITLIAAASGSYYVYGYGV